MIHLKIQINFKNVKPLNETLPSDKITPVSGVPSRDFQQKVLVWKNRLSARAPSNPGMRGSLIGGELSLKTKKNRSWMGWFGCHTCYAAILSGWINMRGAHANARANSFNSQYVCV